MDDKIKYIEDGAVIQLDEPITYKASKLDEEKTVSEIELTTRIKGKHLKAMDQAEGEVGKSLALIAKLSGLPRFAADELSGRDFAAAMEVIEPFLPGSPTTGRG